MPALELHWSAANTSVTSVTSATSTAPRALVLDTNIVLDLLLFTDPLTADLRQLLASGQLRWLATTPMREELARVLQYPQLQPRLAFYGLSAEQLLQRFDASVTPPLLPPAARAPYVCKDADDQKFIDLAAAEQAILLSKDKAVLSLRKRLSTLGADIASCLKLV